MLEPDVGCSGRKCLEWANGTRRRKSKSISIANEGLRRAEQGLRLQICIALLVFLVVGYCPAYRHSTGSHRGGILTKGLVIVESRTVARFKVKESQRSAYDSADQR